MYYVCSNELYHHGIKGQKWGVRRYQNDDGTWTEAGKKRYGVASSGNENKKKKMKFSVGVGIGINNPITEKLGINPMIGVKVGNNKDRAKSTKEKNNAKDIKSTFNEFSNSKNGKELAKRGKSALDVLLNGDQDWMGRSLTSDDPIEEGKNRAKAALERIMYSDEQIYNKKFFGKYNPFD